MGDSTSLFRGGRFHILIQRWESLFGDGRFYILIQRWENLHGGMLRALVEHGAGVIIRHVHTAVTAGRRGQSASYERSDRARDAQATVSHGF